MERKSAHPQQVRQKARILIADDDPHILEVIAFTFNKEGYETILAMDGQQCIEAFIRQLPDLIILDILMPELDGTEVCRIIRQSSSVPIIFLSSKDDEIDKIVGLELGGDDYITKPFSPRELLARVKAVLRRGHSHVAATEDINGVKTMQHGKLLLNPERFQLFWDDSEITMTATEFAILQTLLNSPGKVYSRDELMEKAYSQNTIVTDRTIDSHIRKVRKKFRKTGAEVIQTVRGVGYKLGPCK